MLYNTLVSCVLQHSAAAAYAKLRQGLDLERADLSWSVLFLCVEAYLCKASCNQPSGLYVSAVLLHAAAAYAKLGQGLDLDALEASATAVGSSRRREEVSKKRDAEEEAAGEGAAKVRKRVGAAFWGVCGALGGGCWESSVCDVVMQSNRMPTLQMI